MRFRQFFRSSICLCWSLGRGGGEVPSGETSDEKAPSAEEARETEEEKGGTEDEEAAAEAEADIEEEELTPCLLVNKELVF
mmetsp:Transcript_27465/g.50690  ORF Transcript_27465/g.50690 Transcript_27465/m.50690 type:complete len:81 (-) Transcript_27465:139-381(-)